VTGKFTKGLDFEPRYFLTNSLPEPDRLPFWREVFEKHTVRCEIERRSDDAFEAQAVLRVMPGLFSTSVASTASYIRRPKGMTLDGDEALLLMFSRKGKLHVSQRGRELTLCPGDATLALQGETGTAGHAEKMQCQILVVPRAAIAPLVANVEDLTMRPVPRSSRALNLLISYVKATHTDAGIEQPGMRSVIAGHIHDLVAMSIGATRDGAAVAEGRGVAAARLAAIKADIIQHIGQEGLTVEAVAKRQATTPRSIQRLFEGEGSTFSAFKLEQQLVRACRMLGDPRFAAWTIAAIAFAAGFGDLSYFHRVFLRRFGKTPSDMRAG
jgi:AraC-like DNA-binding protein